ncbi:hypothetical protein QQF64_027262 [Cirrhinus molitorella]|uniref:Uncharacterized protein n=1 Tax=Cirrhinus molitorella TaxID=172907 RepID=A0ABR3NCH6_9TELE
MTLLQRPCLFLEQFVPSGQKSIKKQSTGKKWVREEEKLNYYIFNPCFFSLLFFLSISILALKAVTLAKHS